MGGAALFAHVPKALAATYDLLIKGGRVIDPSVGLDAVAFVEVVREPALNGHTQASSRCPL